MPGLATALSGDTDSMPSFADEARVHVAAVPDERKKPESSLQGISLYLLARTVTSTMNETDPEWVVGFGADILGHRQETCRMHESSIINIKV